MTSKFIKPDKGEVKTGSNPKSSGLLQKYMEISISDTGKGVNEKELKKIFNRFYQGDPP